MDDFHPYVAVIVKKRVDVSINRDRIAVEFMVIFNTFILFNLLFIYIYLPFDGFG